MVQQRSDKDQGGSACASIPREACSGSQVYGTLGTLLEVRRSLGERKWLDQMGSQK